MKNKYIYVMAAICDKCADYVYSRARWDMRYCSCGDIAVDGGKFYTKLSFSDNPPKTKKIRINATEKELYDDWNKRINKFGIIKKCKKKLK